MTALFEEDEESPLQLMGNGKAAADAAIDDTETDGASTIGSITGSDQVRSYMKDFIFVLVTTATVDSLYSSTTTLHLRMHHYFYS